MFDVIRGLIISYCICDIIFPLHSGETPLIAPTIKNIIFNGSIIIPINKKKAIHCHHWMLSFFICLFYPFIKLNPLLGICIGTTIHGLTYCDCFKIICDNPY